MKDHSKIRNFIVYEHISGTPKHLDTFNKEIQDIIEDNFFYHDFTEEEQAEKYIDNINKIQPTDKYGRKRNLYIYWIN